MHTRNANSRHQLCEEFTTSASTSKEQRRSKHITNCARTHTHTRTCTACSDRRGLMFLSQGSLNASVAQRPKKKNQDDTERQNQKTATKPCGLECSFDPTELKRCHLKLPLKAACLPLSFSVFKKPFWRDLIGQIFQGERKKKPGQVRQLIFDLRARRKGVHCIA